MKNELIICTGPPWQGFFKFYMWVKYTWLLTCWYNMGHVYHYLDLDIRNRKQKTSISKRKLCGCKRIPWWHKVFAIMILKLFMNLRYAFGCKPYLQKREFKFSYIEWVRHATHVTWMKSKTAKIIFFRSSVSEIVGTMVQKHVLRICQMIHIVI